MISLSDRQELENIAVHKAITQAIEEICSLFVIPDGLNFSGAYKNILQAEKEFLLYSSLEEREIYKHEYANARKRILDHFKGLQ